MKFLKKIKACLPYTKLLLIPIFLTSFTNNFIAQELDLIDTNLEDTNLIPSQISPTGINELEEQDDDDEEEDDDNEVDLYANPLASIKLGKKKRNDTPLTELQEKRFSRNSASKSMQDVKINTAQQKEDADRRYRSSIVLNSLVNQIEINQMIEDRLPNLDKEQHDFLDLMANLSPTELNPQLINAMYDVEQIRFLQNYTNHFTNTSKLPPYAFLYLNACAEFYPIAQELNQQYQTDPRHVNITDSSDISIQSFDFFHVFIGEMKVFNNVLDDNHHYESMLKGGHLYLPSLSPYVRLFEKYDFDKQSQYFNIILRSLSTTGRSIKTFYPFGLTPQECFNLLLDAIDRHNNSNQFHNITQETDDLGNTMTSIEFIGNDVDIILNIPASGIATFYPKLKDSI